MTSEEIRGGEFYIYTPPKLLVRVDQTLQIPVPPHSSCACVTCLRWL